MTPEEIEHHTSIRMTKLITDVFVVNNPVRSYSEALEALTTGFSAIVGEFVEVEMDDRDRKDIRFLSETMAQAIMTVILEKVDTGTSIDEMKSALESWMVDVQAYIDKM